jgi:hypothetical protein
LFVTNILQATALLLPHFAGRHLPAGHGPAQGEHAGSQVLPLSQPWYFNRFYSLLSVTVIFLQADICQLGMDQRKVNMLAREYCDDIKRKLKPIILSHRMMPGLLEVRGGFNC